MNIIEKIINAIKLFFGIDEKKDTIDIGGGLSVVVETEMVEVKEEPIKKATKATKVTKKKTSKKKATKKKASKKKSSKKKKEK